MVYLGLPNLKMVIFHGYVNQPFTIFNHPIVDPSSYGIRYSDHATATKNQETKSHVGE